MEELDVVTLLTDLPAEGLKAGAVGAVVHVFRRPGLAYEIEFVDPDGTTAALVTLTADQVRAVRS